MNDEHAYVYALVDPDTDIVRYVGVTIDPECRLRQHEATSRKCHTTAHKWMDSLWSRGKSPRMVLLERISVRDFTIAERRWQFYFGKQLVNGMMGQAYGEFREVDSPVPLPPEPDRPKLLPPHITPDDLRAYRAAHGLSQRGLAKLLRVHYSAVSLWESGKRRVPEYISLPKE